MVALDFRKIKDPDLSQVHIAVHEEDKMSRTRLKIHF
jgi:hypothetical protein